MTWRCVNRCVTHPAAARSASRSRSRSNARRVRWKAKPSTSTASRLSGQWKSTSSPTTRSFTRGRARPATSQSVRNASSRSLRVSVDPAAPSARRAASSGAPGRPRCAATTRCRSARSKIRSTSAWSSARSTARRGCVAATSSRVRAGEVTGMAERIAVSPGASAACLRTHRPGRRRPAPLRTVTSMRRPPGGRRPHSAAALAWLRYAAAGPSASTAAIQKPSGRSAAWPAA